MKTITLIYKNDEELEEAPEQKNIIQMPQSVFETMTSLMMQMSEQLKANNATNISISPDAIARSIQEGIQMSQNRSAYKKTFTKDEITIDDTLDKPAIFFANKISTTIFDDVIKGKVIMCPYAPVKFTTVARYESPNAKGKIITQSMAIVWSKKQAEFLRGHSDFNIRFFERAEDAKKLNHDFMDKVVECYTSVKNYTDYQVQQKLIEFNVRINTDNFTELRKKLAYKMAENFIDRAELIRTEAIEDLNLANSIRLEKEKSQGSLEEAY